MPFYLEHRRQKLLSIAAVVDELPYNVFSQRSRQVHVQSTSDDQDFVRLVYGSIRTPEEQTEDI